MNLNKIISSINEASTIAILPHVFADGDAIGSSLAFMFLLKKLGKSVTVYMEEPIPFVYDFLPGTNEVTIFKGDIKNYDLAISLDTGDYDRIGKRNVIFDNAKTTINIDHHPTNTEFAVHNYIDSKASATGEIIYEIIKLLNEKSDIDMAICLYVAIATDTGGFRFSNTTEMTHRIVADLVSLKIDISMISQKIFDSVSLGKVKLLGEAINTLELFENGRIAVLTISDEAMKRAGAREEDCDGIVNTGRNINSVEIAALLRMRDNGEIKVNFRSKNYVDVSAIANLYKGGGHKRAAGCTVTGKIEDVRKKIIEDLKESL